MRLGLHLGDVTFFLSTRFLPRLARPLLAPPFALFLQTERSRDVLRALSEREAKKSARGWLRQG